MSKPLLKEFPRSFYILSAGNPGAMNVLAEVWAQDATKYYDIVCELQDLDFKGAQIWIVYANLCNHDIHKFRAKLSETRADVEKIKALREEVERQR